MIHLKYAILLIFLLYMIHANAITEQSNPQVTQNQPFWNGIKSYFSQLPYPGITPTFRGSELIGAYPYINTDFLLLQQRLKANIYYQQNNIAPPDHLQMRLGGRIQIRAYKNDTFLGKKSNHIYLYKAEIYNELLINPWLTGFVALAYDPNTRVANFNEPQPTVNSRIFLDRAFITLGNLYKNPFYTTVGQFWAPFGIYNTFMLTPPLTRLMSKTKVRSALIGYSHAGIYAQSYLFKGNTTTDANTTINQGGLNLGYFGKHKMFAWDIGGGYISNIADSDGMQKVNGGSCAPHATFGGFGACTRTEELDHSVPAFNLHSKLTIGRTAFITEWIGAQRAFAPKNLSFDGHGAKPQALTTEVAYNFKVYGRPTTFGLAYGETKEALALNLAKQRYAATLTTSIWRHTVQKLEFRHELNYPPGSKTTGQGAPSTNVKSLGKTSNTLTVEFSVYF